MPTNHGPDSAGPAVRGTAGLNALTAEQRARIALHAQGEVADRVLRQLCERAALAQAEYRFMDLMDRYFLVVASSVVLALLLSVGLADLTLRWVSQAFGDLAACRAQAPLLAAVMAALPLYLGGLTLYLRRKVMGGLWLRTEKRLPWVGNRPAPAARR
jgi:hypothetical protein